MNERNAQTTKWIASELAIWLMRSSLATGTLAMILAPFVDVQHAMLMPIPMLVLLVSGLAAEGWSVISG